MSSPPSIILCLLPPGHEWAVCRCQKQLVQVSLRCCAAVSLCLKQRASERKSPAQEVTGQDGSADPRLAANAPLACFGFTVMRW